MSFIRPEAQDFLRRWAEALIGGVILTLGLIWIITGRGFLPYIGAALAVMAAVLIWLGVQRGRFHVGRDAPGVVQVAEGEISYFGPLAGGMRPIAGLKAVLLDPTAHPACWVLQAAGHEDLYIPLDAEGADLLFDAFAALPGLKTAHMLRQMENRPDHPVVIWHAPPQRLH